MTKIFTRYEVEFHDPATRYVLAEDHEAATLEYARRVDVTFDEMATLRADNDRLRARAKDLRVERDRLQRLADTLTRELAEANATRYPVENPANPLLSFTSGPLRFEVKVFSDEDYGDWFEVKNATPTEPLGLCDLRPSAVPTAREALRQWREDHQRDMEESRGV